jgi:hypothetical protein
MQGAKRQKKNWPYCKVLEALSISAETKVLRFRPGALEGLGRSARARQVYRIAAAAFYRCCNCAFK